MRTIIIDDNVFEKYPDFKRGIIIVSDINNDTQVDAIAELLAKEVSNKKDFDFASSIYISAWDEAHRNFDSNPNKFPPSIKALLKRVSKGADLPYINSAVALFNYISLKYLIPCGGDDVEMIEGDLRLGFSTGDENFIPLGTEEKESPVAGEVIYYDDKTKNVMCRRWNWRNGDFTKIGQGSKRLVINIDGIGAAAKELIEEARDELAALMAEHCAANLKTDLLSTDKRSLEIDI